MEQLRLPDGALEVLLKEYDTLRTEISERLKVAFTHVAYGGAIVAFAVPASNEVPSWVPMLLPLLLALLGVIALCWVAFLNMRWVQHCGVYLKTIEDRVNTHFGHTVLGWENYASNVQARLFMFLPKDPFKTDKR